MLYRPMKPMERNHTNIAGPNMNATCIEFSMLSEMLSDQERLGAAKTFAPQLVILVLVEIEFSV